MEPQVLPLLGVAAPWVGRIYPRKAELQTLCASGEGKNVCSDPRVSIFHKSAQVGFSFNANKKKIHLD